MAAPTPSTRATPGGRMLRDGYKITVAFSLDTDISLQEVAITPPALEGGEEIDITTQWNDRWMTYAMQQLMKLGNLTFTCAYDPIIYEQCQTILNNDTGSVTLRFADGSTIAFFGGLKTATPDQMVKGTQPRMTCVVVATNFDRTNNVEAGLVVTSVSGT